MNSRPEVYYNSPMVIFNFRLQPLVQEEGQRDRQREKEAVVSSSKRTAVERWLYAIYRAFVGVFAGCCVLPLLNSLLLLGRTIKTHVFTLLPPEDDETKDRRSERATTTSWRTVKETTAENYYYYTPTMTMMMANAVNDEEPRRRASSKGYPIRGGEGDT